MKKCLRKVFSITIVLALIVTAISMPSFSSSIDRLNCPYCSESDITILDDEYGVCHCDSCDSFFIIVNGQVKLVDGTTMSLIDIYDIDALIRAIENGEFDTGSGSESSSSSSSSSGNVDEDDDNNKDSDLGTGDVAYSLNASYKSLFETNSTTKYGDTFKKFEPETDEELLEYLAKKSKNSDDENYEDTPEENEKATKSSLEKNIYLATNSNSDSKKNSNENTKRISDIPHVIRYYISIDSDIYIPEVVFNGVEFNMRNVQVIPGFTFKGWSLTKDGKKTYKDGSPMILYNFNSDSKASPNVFNFYAIWEKD